MKWTIEQLEGRNLIRVDSQGEFNHQDHQRKMDEIVSKDYWKPGMNILFDCRNVDFSGLSILDVRKVVSDYVNRLDRVGHGKIALLMRSKADFGRGRQFEMLAEDKISADVGIFLDEIQSLEWLES